MKEKSRTDAPKKKTRKQKSEEYLKYQKYIRSKEFQKVREIVIERDRCCQFCGRTAEELEGTKLVFSVHHRSYDHLYEGGELEASDCILCDSGCHRYLHMCPSNRQRFKIKLKDKDEKSPSPAPDTAD